MRTAAALLLIALLPACAAPAVGPSIPGGGFPPVERTLPSISAGIFTPRCASSACHGGTGNAPLDLRPEAAWLALVNAPSTQTDELPLVTPLDPDRSYLLRKLLGTHATTGSGAAMPPDGDPLDPEQLQAISDWIADGAPP